MRPVTARFLDAVRYPHTFVTRVDVLRARIPINEGVPTVGGTVDLDRTAEIRGRCQLTLGGEAGRIPTGAFDALTPFGNEVQIYRGVLFPDGPELVSLGIFGIGSIKVDDLAGTVEVGGFDRAQLVKDADFESTYTVAAGTNYGSAIQSLVDAGVPGLTYRFAPVDAVTPLLVFDADTDGGRWAAAQQMAASCGCDLYFDGDGALVLAPVPDVLGSPAIELHDGPGGVVVSASKVWDRAPGYNAVIAYSSNPTPGVTPPRAVARDLDPASPTYYYGDFGRKPRRYSSTFITTQAQAQTAADAILRQTLGVAQTIELSISTNPALEPGDIASVRRTTLGLDEADVIDSEKINLDAAGVMTLGVRARQVAA